MLIFSSRPRQLVLYTKGHLSQQWLLTLWDIPEIANVNSILLSPPPQNPTTPGACRLLINKIKIPNETASLSSLILPDRLRSQSTTNVCTNVCTGEQKKMGFKTQNSEVCFRVFWLLAWEWWSLIVLLLLLLFAVFYVVLFHFYIDIRDPGHVCWGGLFLKQIFEKDSLM